MTEVKSLSPVTLEEFETMEREEQFSYELIDGVVMMSPRPAFYHQEISSNIQIKLSKVLDTSYCKPFTETTFAIKNTYLVPDISVYCIGQDIPFIVFEILSPATRSRDLVYKPFKYRDFGVKEYWIIDPDLQVITVHDFVNDTSLSYTKEQTVCSLAIREIVFVVAEVLQQLISE